MNNDSLMNLYDINTLIEKVCRTCGKRYHIKKAGLTSKKRVYCSRECYQIDRMLRADKHLRKNCIECGKEFRAIKKHNRFCSTQCAHINYGKNHSGVRASNYKGGKIIVECRQCQKEFYINKARIGIAKYCSCKCRSMYTSKGINNSNWKGGIQSLTQMIRSSDKYKEWIAFVFKRDNYACKDCGQIGHSLNAHHKKAFSIILKEFLNKNSHLSPMEDKAQLEKLSYSYLEFWDINNGKTVCDECHSKYGTRPDKANTMLYAAEGPKSSFSV